VWPRNASVVLKVGQEGNGLQCLAQTLMQ
jgi:hypothetical protein